MKVIIIGAGVIGTTTAYYMQQMGADVTLIDQSTPGSGASRGNGGQLSYSFVAPLAEPGVITKIPLWLMQPSSPLRFTPSTSIKQWRWICAFLRACTRRQSYDTTLALLGLAAHSREQAETLMNAERIDCAYTESGKLVLYRDASSLAVADRQRLMQAPFSGKQYLLSSSECIDREQALKVQLSKIAGGIWTPSEAVLDAEALCVQLAKKITERGGTVLRNCKVLSLSKANTSVRAAVTEHANLLADAFVVAAGNASNALTEPLNVPLLMEPLKGYSISAPIRDDTLAPRISVTDAARKIVFARIGTQLRVAGMAELVGFDKRIRHQRIEQLFKATRDNFGDCVDFNAATHWAGFRPATPTSLPFISRTPLSNLYLNTGHGALGVTLSFGSSHLLATMIHNDYAGSSGQKALASVTTRLECFRWK